MSISGLKLGDHRDIIDKYNIPLPEVSKEGPRAVWFVPVADESDAAIRLRRLNISKNIRILGYESVVFEPYYIMKNDDIWDIVKDYNVYIFSQFDKRQHELMLFLKQKNPRAILLRDHCEAMFGLEYEAECFIASDAVVCSSHYLRDLSILEGFPHSYTIEDSIEDIDYSKYPPHYESRNRAVFMGGYGQSRIVSEILKPHIFHAGYDITLITENESAGKKWSLDTWADDFYDNDVALCSQPAYMLAKSNVKVVNAMAFGMPVLASPIPSYKRIIEHGVNGFLCPSIEDWGKYLRELKDLDLRKKIGQNALNTAQEFTPKRIATKWLDLFNTLLSTKPL